MLRSQIEKTEPNPIVLYVYSPLWGHTMSCFYLDSCAYCENELKNSMLYFNAYTYRTLTLNIKHDYEKLEFYHQVSLVHATSETV